MAKLHPNTDFDPDARAVEFITELEREALDEHQVADALQVAIATMQSRQDASRQVLNDAMRVRVMDNRNALIAAKQKGVRPVPQSSGVIQTASVIPMKAVGR